MSFIKSLNKKNQTDQIEVTINVRLTQEEDHLLTLATQQSGYKRNELFYLLAKEYIFDDESLRKWLRSLALSFQKAYTKIVMWLTLTEFIMKKMISS